jgi:hypothetical protein
MHRPLRQALRHTIEHASINDRQRTHGRRLTGPSATPAAAPAAPPGTPAVSPCPPQNPPGTAADTSPPHTNLTARQLPYARGIALQNNQFWPPQPADTEKAPSIQTSGQEPGYHDPP